MPIKRTKKTTSVVSLPNKLDELVRNGMTASCLEKKYKEEGKSFRDEIKTELETGDFEIEISKAIKTEYGNLTFKSRANFDIDKDALLELVDNGVITLHSLIQIASINAVELKKIVGDKKFSDIATEKATEYLELRPNSEFKATVERAFNPPSLIEEEVVKEKPKAKAKKTTTEKLDKDIKKLEEDVASSLEKLKKLKSKSEKTTSATDELDAILAE